MHRKESRLAHLTHEDRSLYRDHEGCALVRYEWPFLLNIMKDNHLYSINATVHFLIAQIMNIS